jgi:hypothetical protein
VWDACKLLWKCKWRYDLSATVDLDSEEVVTIKMDKHTVVEEDPTPLPDDAFTGPTANGNQQLSYYVGGKACYIIVPRTEE